MSVVTRLLGAALGLAGGYMIGTAQGVQSLIDSLSNVGSQTVGSIPNLDPYIASVISAYFYQNMEQRFNGNYGSYWAFGIILLVFSFVLLARGTGKPAIGEEREGPLIPQTVPTKQDGL